jgi:hypothetical protein
MAKQGNNWARWLSLRLKKTVRLFEVDRPFVPAEAFAGDATMTQRYFAAQGSKGNLNDYSHSRGVSINSVCP